MTVSMKRNSSMNRGRGGLAIAKKDGPSITEGCRWKAFVLLINNVSTLLSMTDGVWLSLVTWRHGRRRSGLVNVLVSKSSRMFLCWGSWQLTCYFHMHTASLRIPVFIGIHTTIWTVKATWQSIYSGKGRGKPQMGYYPFKEDQISYSLSIVGTLR